MRLKDFGRAALYSLKGWYQTFAYAAPEGMEDVETNYSYIDDSHAIKNTLSEHRRFVDQYRATSEEYQIPEDGVGALYHRKYEIEFVSKQSVATIMQGISKSPDYFCDPQLAKFRKSRGSKNEMLVGDRFDISITGPWNGPVEVIEKTDESFSFVTLDGHMESGFISFRVEKSGPEKTSFLIESWATNTGFIVWLSYEILGISMKMQTKMWRYYCLKVAKEFGIGSPHLSVKTFKCRNPKGDYQ